MYAVTFPGSIAGMAVYLYRCHDGVRGEYGVREWHRAEHIARVFRHQEEAEKALADYIAWIKKETRFIAPELNGYLVERLKKAEIIMEHDIPEKTEGGTPFRLQTEDDQVMIDRRDYIR